MAARLVIADDHALVRDGLRLNLEAQHDLQVVGEAVNGREAVACAEELRPEVMVMDIAMPELNGIEATRLITERSPETRVLILSMHNSSEYTFRAVRSGARGYLLKESAGEEVVAAVRAILRGRHYFGAGVAAPLELLEGGTWGVAKSPLESLSRRELEVFQLVVEGNSSAQIGARLSLSSKSVDTYRSRLMRKLGVVGMPALVSYALQHGITPPK